ncbi:MAG: acyltransferase [Candidatus Omnitrophica bacterium]|nr:acyltransferase [Candidatus Omnitrophota bacterium]
MSFWVSLKRRIGVECFYAGQQLVAMLPDHCGAARYAFYRRFLQQAGRFHSMSGLKIYCPEGVKIGEGVSMNIGVVLDPSDGGAIEIGNNVLIGPYCVLRAADHVFSDPAIPIKDQGHRGGAIVIEDDCWLGSHVVVTRSVRIGRGCVIGAHSVVTHDIPPYTVAAGVPATVLRQRGDRQEQP